MRRFQLSVWCLCLMAAQVVAGDSPLSTQGTEACSTTETAQSLVRCDGCHALKEILGEVEGRNLRIDVYDFSSGVFIQLAGMTAEDNAVLNRVAGQVWGLSDESGAAAANFCDVCQQRSRKLQRSDRDRVTTVDGVVVLLTSADGDLVAWLREDARMQQRLLNRAVASN